MNIRLYQTSDLPRLIEITLEAFEPVSIDRNMEDQVGPIHGHDWRWRKARYIEEDVREQPDGVFVAEMEGEVVGYITTRRDNESGIGLIPNMAVAVGLRGQGIGRRLIHHALDSFRRHGLSYARIETLEQNPVGQSLYPSFGFREIARQIHYGLWLEDEPAP